jgi:thioredoxin 1
MNLTDQNFATEIADKNLIIMFSAEGCAPCRQMQPLVNELDYVHKMMIDENPKTATQFKIHAVPTIVALKNGEEKARLVGVQSKQTIESIYNGLQK